MFGFINRWKAKQQAVALTKHNIEVINSNGGSDMLCFRMIDFITDNTKWAKLRNGVLEYDEYPMTRTLLITAATQSIVQARQDLTKTMPVEEEQKTRARLEVAEQAFLLSYLLISDEDKAGLDPDEVARSRQAMIEKAFDTSGGINPLKGFDLVAERKITDARLEQGRADLEKWKSINPFDHPVVCKVRMG